MKNEDLKAAKEIETRINQLDAEIMALFDATNKKINPFKPFHVRGQIFGNYDSDFEIRLTKQDINALQAIRSAELEHLRELFNNL